MFNWNLCITARLLALELDLFLIMEDYIFSFNFLFSLLVSNKGVYKLVLAVLLYKYLV